MRLIKLMVVVCLSIATPASAAEWIEVSKSDYSSTYIDETSITKDRDGLVLYLAKIEYARAIDTPFVYTSNEGSIIANCLQRTRAIHQSTYFNGQDVAYVSKVAGDFETPQGAGLVLLNYACDKAENGTDQAVNDGRPNGAATTSRNMRATTTLFKHPSVLLGELIIKPLAPAIFAYGLVWLFMRPKGQKQLDKMSMWHFWGVVITDIGGALFRLIAMATFAGHSAYDLPAAAGGVAALYTFIVPAFFSAAYIMWLKKKIAYKNGVGHFESTNLNNRSNIAGSNEPVQERKNETAPVPIKTPAENKITSIEKNDEAIDLARYKQAAEEIGTGNRDDALWYKAFAEGGGDDKATKATYIRLRVEQLRRAAVAASAVRVTAMQPAQQVPRDITTQAANPNGSNNLYDILGISRTASDAQINAAYQLLKWELDAQGHKDAETKNKLLSIQHAQRVLLDPARRSAYDANINQ